MITNAKDRTLTEMEKAQGGEGVLKLDKLFAAPNQPAKVRMYAKATLEPGHSIGYHEHHGESETYFFLSGTGLYNDNGKEVPVSAGDVTYTPSGEGHGILNTGDEPLVFMALIVLD